MRRSGSPEVLEARREIAARIFEQGKVRQVKSTIAPSRRSALLASK